MVVEYVWRNREISVSECESILIKSKEQNGYEWDEVFFKSEEGILFIGTYPTYDYGMSYGWMDYNSETIALLKRYMPGNDVDGIRINALFDIKNRLLIEGSEEYLFKYYNQQFRKKDEKVDSPEKLVLKKNK